MDVYLPRIADEQLAARMRVMGAVLIEGPKACGKTATASQIAKTIIRFDEDETARSMMGLNPAALFEGEPPILFDEWQLKDAVWNRVRRQVDDRNLPGQFILTGSATPRDDAARHSGTGRIAVVRMRPMSLYESGQSNGEVSLAALLDGETQTGRGDHMNFDELLHRIVVGGWPKIINSDEHDARDWLADYLAQIAETDVPNMGHRRNPTNLQRLFASLARHVGQPVVQAELAKDVGGEAGPVADETISGYLDALARLNITENSLSWRPHMRSRTRLRTAPVRYFVDPSLGPAALNVGTAELRKEPLVLGFHFEALVMRDLRIYSAPLRGQVDSWRDANGNEIDAIVSLRGNKWAAFEIKLNPRDVDDAAAALLRLAANVDTNQHGEPACLGVITSTGAAGRREDGVHVIPIGCLGP